MRYKPRDVRVDAIEWRGEMGDFPAAWKSLDMMYIDDVGDLVVRTPNGPGRAKLGWFVIQGLAGELYPVPPGIFHQRWMAES